MRCNVKNLVLIGALLSAVALHGQQSIPNGTILPLELKSSLNSHFAKAGQVITARIAQDVPLPEGRIREGSKVIGHVVAVTRASDNGPADISLRFDTLLESRNKMAITTNLRALASPMSVWDAQLPLTGPDRGSPENTWNTVLVGDDEVAYRGGGPVAKGLEVVGEPTAGGGVLANLSAAAGTKCHGKFQGNDRLQALWVFSSDACGLYGLPDLTLSHAGRSNPVGEIKLASMKGEVELRSGGGILLRVMQSTP